MAKKSSNLFAKLELDYADHPKIAPLSDAAFRLHVEMILYSRKYETDGVIKNRLANRMALRWDSDVLTELATNDENSPSLIKLDNGDYLINGYADVQETKAEIAARRATNSQNGKLGGRPKKTQSVTEPKTKPGTQNKAETETETETDIKESEPAKPDAPRGNQTPEHRATDAAYETTGKAFNFIAVRAMAKWMIKDRGLTEPQVTQAIVDTYQAGKPITKQVLGQLIDGYNQRSNQQTTTDKMNQTMLIAQQLEQNIQGAIEQ